MDALRSYVGAQVANNRRQFAELLDKLYESQGFTIVSAHKSKDQKPRASKAVPSKPAAKK